MTSGKKWLVGLAIGCGGLILVCGIAAISIWLWISRPGELLIPAHLLGEDATGYAEWTLRLEDPGTAVVAEQLIERLGEHQRAHAAFPPWFATWLAGQQERKANADLKKVFPMVLVWTMRPAEDRDLHLVSLSLARVGKRLWLLDWFLGFTFGRDRDVKVIRHGDETLYEIVTRQGHRFTFFIRGNDIFVATDPTTAEQAVDRLTAPAGSLSGESRGPVQALLARTSEDQPLRVAIDNRTGTVDDLVSVLYERLAGTSPTPALWEPVRALTISGRLEPAGSLSATLELIGPDDSWASTNADAIVAELRRLSTTERPVVLDGRADGERIRVALRVDDVAAILARSLGGILRLAPRGVTVELGKGAVDAQ